MLDIQTLTEMEDAIVRRRREFDRKMDQEEIEDLWRIAREYQASLGKTTMLPSEKNQG